jgi:hypothetical protein
MGFEAGWSAALNQFVELMQAPAEALAPGAGQRRSPTPHDSTASSCTARLATCRISSSSTLRTSARTRTAAA